MMIHLCGTATLQFSCSVCLSFLFSEQRDDDCTSSVHAISFPPCIGQAGTATSISGTLSGPSHRPAARQTAPDYTHFAAGCYTDSPLAPLFVLYSGHLLPSGQACYWYSLCKSSARYYRFVACNANASYGWVGGRGLGWWEWDWLGCWM